MGRTHAIGAMVAALAMSAGGAQAVELVTNGGFDTGDFTGWTLFTTANGAIGPAPAPRVTLFDVAGGESLAAEFQVGQVVFTSGVYAGGGIFQTINTSAGTLNFSANIASLGSNFGLNGDGGLYSVLLDGVVKANVDMASIDGAPATEHAILGFSSNVTAGSHLLTLQVTRRFLYGAAGLGRVPRQYIDDISATQDAVVPGVPEPASWALMIAGFGLAGGQLRRRVRATA